MLASRKAVELAGEAFMRMAPDLYGDSAQIIDWMVRFFSDSGSLFENWVTELAADINDYSTTLATVVLVDDWVAVASIGDSFIVSMDDNAGLTILLPPHRPNAMATSECYMLADFSLHTQYRAYWCPGLRGVLLSTDGLEKFLLYGARRKLDTRRGEQVVLGAHQFLESLLSDFIHTQGEEPLRRLDENWVRTSKRDDIGIAMAARHGC